MKSSVILIKKKVKRNYKWGMECRRLLSKVKVLAISNPSYVLILFPLWKLMETILLLKYLFL